MNLKNNNITLNYNPVTTLYILAFETSCDDTSIAIFENSNLVDMETISQIKEHEDTCGVVPEVAARLHSNNIFIALDNILSRTWIKLEQFDYIVCTEEPGLLPSLYVGLTTANSLSKILSKPLILVNHIEAHIFANLLERNIDEIIFPSVVLTVSGWHNELYIWKSLFELELIGETQDDSAGEAFDKVAKMMWLGFPGWPAISRLSSEFLWDFQGIFPRVLLSKDSLNFSFSWLKSAVKREIDRRIENWKLKIENNGSKDNNIIRHSELVSESFKSNNFSTKYLQDIQEVEKFLSLDDKKQIAYEFENTVVDILTTKLIAAAKKYWINSLVLAWWVSANSRLKDSISVKAKENNFTFIHPKKIVYSQDNAAMVGMLWYYKIINQKI